MIIQCPSCKSRYETSGRNAGDSIHCHCGVDIYVPALKEIAKNWKCPNCGGSVDPTKNRCDYCDAYLAFARCPACFSIAPYDDAKHCAECGELLTRPIKPIQKDKSSLSCPRCSSPLQNQVVNSHLVEVCRECNGVWLSHDLMDRLLQDEPPNTIGALNQLPPRPEKLPYHPVKYLPCPDCQTLMSRHNFMSSSNIIVDQCSQHGIWFDKHELSAALEYLRSSGGGFKGKQNNFESRSHEEIFEIKEEDLALLLSEFPDWIKK